MVKVERINLQKEGLTKFFSPNEVRILELLWEKGDMTSAQISEELENLSHAVVAGTLDRLVKSSFVERRLDEGGPRMRYIYSPVGDRNDVGLRISERVIDSLFETFGDATLSALGKVRKENEAR
ncbi:MAG: MarR family transcriptional regulator [Thermoplasmata archaeon]|nr:MarR family transcriptional regulator [Thermoplasmata archaeon]